MNNIRRATIDGKTVTFTEARRKTLHVIQKFRRCFDDLGDAIRAKEDWETADKVGDIPLRGRAV